MPLGVGRPALDPQVPPHVGEPALDARQVTGEEPPGGTAGTRGRPWRAGLNTAVAVLAVALVAGSLGVLVEQRRARAGAADGVRMMGIFVPDGVAPMAVGAGVARAGGYLHMVNAGVEAVEIVGAEVAGVPVDPFPEDQRIEPGASAAVRAALELPCSQVPSERMAVEVRVASAGGLGTVRQIELAPLEVGSHYDLADHVVAVCSGGDVLVRATRMEMDADGRVTLDLRSMSRTPTDVRVWLSPLMGARVNGASSVSTVVPADGATQLLLDIAVVDCTRARLALGRSYEVLMVDAENWDRASMGYLEGWQPTVATAAFGFALARQCG